MQVLIIYISARRLFRGCTQELSNLLLALSRLRFTPDAAWMDMYWAVSAEQLTHFRCAHTAAAVPHTPLLPCLCRAARAGQACAQLQWCPATLALLLCPWCLSSREGANSLLSSEAQKNTRAGHAAAAHLSQVRREPAGKVSPSPPNPACSTQQLVNTLWAAVRVGHAPPARWLASYMKVRSPWGSRLMARCLMARQQSGGGGGAAAAAALRQSTRHLALVP